MTQEQKDLLLRDLCTRLPYGVRISYRCNHIHELRATLKNGLVMITDIITNEYVTRSVENIIPYLFPLSSMTEEQKEEYRKVCDLDMTILENRPMKGEPFPAMFNSQDWLDAHHFDYRGLITLNLAIDATGLNIY